jgi:hypothetical protein
MVTKVKRISGMRKYGNFDEITMHFYGVYSATHSVPIIYNVDGG